MAHVLETSYRKDGSGIGRVMNGRYPVATIYWGTQCVDGQCLKASEVNDVLGLVTTRLADETENGFGSPANAQAIALIEQAKTLLSGGQTEMPDGTPIFGGSE